MRKKEMKTEKTGVVVPLNESNEEASGEKKPRRGRKPKAVKQQEEAAAAAESETVSEAVEETATETDTTAETETAQETEEMPAAETESTVQESADTEQDGAPSETAPEADTEPENDTAEEPAAEGETVQKEATEEDNTEESAEEPEPGQEEKAPVPVPVPAVSTQIIDSPLKRMKQEFSERSQIIREQMRNIQNAFITIGFQLHWIRENNMFRVLNYKNVYEYAEKEYGLKKTTCCNFISIIENYAERDENGEVIESIADCYCNYSASQLVAMLGMNEDMRQQVSPDMSVRAINRLRKGDPEPGTVEASSAPVKEPGKEPAVEKDTENPAAEEAVPDDTVREEEPEAGEMQEAEITETAAEDDTAREEEPEDTGAAPQMDDDVRELPEEAVPNENVGTLAEIDSYTDYQSMQDELDLIMRNVFAEDSSVRVKIVCVQG